MTDGVAASKTIDNDDIKAGYNTLTSLGTEDLSSRKLFNKIVYHSQTRIEA